MIAHEVYQPSQQFARWENVCEHGDHPAPAGKRFCSDNCRACENQGDDECGCAGICTGSIEDAMQAAHGAISVVEALDLQRYGCCGGSGPCAWCAEIALEEREEEGLVEPWWRTVRGYRPITFPIGATL